MGLFFLHFHFSEEPKQARLLFRIKKPQPDSPRAERMWCRVLEHAWQWDDAAGDFVRSA